MARRREWQGLCSHQQVEPVEMGEQGLNMPGTGGYEDQIQGGVVFPGLGLPSPAQGKGRVMTEVYFKPEYIKFLERAVTLHDNLSSGFVSRLT